MTKYAAGWFLVMCLIMVGCGGATAAPSAPTAADTTLYASPQRFAPATPLDGYNVVASYGLGATVYTRTIPVLVRYPAGTTGLLPLILWSHGGDKNVNGKYANADWADALVRAGYIMVSMSHLPRTDAERARLAAEFGIPANAVTVAVESNIDRPRDAIATLNALRRIEAAFPELAGRIDYTRIGLGGHSRGAYTVRTTACARVDLPGFPDYSFLDATRPTNTPLTVQPHAYLANSPQGPGRFGFTAASWRDCVKPDMTQSGDGDNTDELAVDRIKPFDLMPTGDKYKMYIADPNTPHETFNLNHAEQPLFESYVRTTGVAFFDAYVKELPSARAYLAAGTLARASGSKATITAR
jgi:predicted dienelactone hydrolase